MSHEEEGERNMRCRLPAMPMFQMEDGSEDGGSDEEDGEGEAAAAREDAEQLAGQKRKRPGGKGRRKIPIEYIKDKNRRSITFSKRKAGIFSKARELTTLTGSSMLLLVVSESGVVYTYTTEKFQPLLRGAGKSLISACLAGTVAGEEYDEQPRDVRKGGQIMLKDAYHLKAESGSSRASSRPPTRPKGKAKSDRSPVLPPAPGPETMLDPPPMPAPGPANAGLSNEWYGQAPAHVDSLSDMQAQYAAIAQQQQQHQQQTAQVSGHDEHPGQAEYAHDLLVGTGQEDVDEDECARRMRMIRRSLSIERQFEENTAQERPAVGDEQQHQQAAPASNNSQLFNSRISFTESANAWSNWHTQFSNVTMAAPFPSPGAPARISAPAPPPQTASAPPPAVHDSSVTNGAGQPSAGTGSANYEGASIFDRMDMNTPMFKDFIEFKLRTDPSERRLMEEVRRQMIADHQAQQAQAQQGPDQG